MEHDRIVQRVIVEIEKLPLDEQNAVASRILAELEDDKAWRDRFEATTDEQGDRLADMARREIDAGDVVPLDDVFPPESSSP